jgi:hypothetical protein
LSDRLADLINFVLSWNIPVILGGNKGRPWKVFLEMNQPLTEMEDSYFLS